VIGGPDYSTPPVGDLIMRYSGQGNNVLAFELRRSVAERYSHLTVLGQTHGTNHGGVGANARIEFDPVPLPTADETGKHAISAAEKDEEMAAIAYRPKIVVDYESDNTATARDRARKLIADARLRGFTLLATVKGHRIVAPGQASDGVLWAPGQRLRVCSEPHGLEGIFFVMGRKFSGGRSDGATTQLTLKEDGVWTLDAHPHKRPHRRNYAAREIVDIVDEAGVTP
jgi:prophage tail gpP-like protein